MPYHNRRGGQDDPYGDVPQAQEFAREGVEGYGEMLKPELMRQIGTTLGGLNEIGALRSGAVPVHLAEVGESYGNQVGAYAKMATGEAIGHGLEAGRQRFAREEARRRRQGALLRSIGMALGSAVGFFANRQGGGGGGEDAGGEYRA